VVGVPGILGGADQAQQSSQAYLGPGFQLMAVSRFGYLGSPLPLDPSPAAQADRYAALLDRLGLQRVAVVGFSAGGPSSLQFALRHAERCSSLVLWSMAVPPYPVPADGKRPVLAVGCRSNLALWYLMRFAPARLLGITGVPAPVQAQLTPPQRKWLSVLMHSFLPISQRAKGIVNDICISNPDLNCGYALERIQVPTLVVHAVDDPMPPFAGAQRMAEQIPAARFLAIESGGHLLLGHQDLVRAQIATFISDHAPSFAVAIGNHSATQPPPAFVGRFSPNRPVDIRQPGDFQ
jgi:2-hydroxy-6-oxonona-2,4-dienedioate hydrolase